MDSERVIKIAIVGDSCVGKSCFISRHVSGKFIADHIPTTKPSYYHINYNDVELIVGEGDSFVEQSDSIMVMFDVTNIKTYKNALDRVKSLMVKHSDSKIILLGNKVDSINRTVRAKRIKRDVERLGVKYLDVSAKSNYQFDKPFIHIITTITNKKNSNSSGRYDILPFLVNMSLMTIQPRAKL